MSDDLRLIEDYLPIEAISAEASREKSVRKGHISTLHLWWARRPLVACRAAVYGALVPADRWVKEVELTNPPLQKGGPGGVDEAKAVRLKNGKKKGLNRKAAKEFVTKLCRYPKTNPTNPADIKIKRETEAAIVEAQRHILEAHAERLTAELAEAQRTGKIPAWVDEFKWPFSFNGKPEATASFGLPRATASSMSSTTEAGACGLPLNDDSKTIVTYDDIIAGRAPRPRVLDMFAGGGAIPLEALRLGCEAYALDLNPVARGLADPGQVDVAVFDGEKFTATGGKEVGGGQMVHTIWGWLAWQLGPKSFKVVAKHDADRVSPAGDEIKDMLAAGGKPVLLLLDEVLKYMERAAAVGVKDSTLQRQAKDFLQNLTVEVSNSTNAVMVYSLQWSAREALGNIALLEEIDHLTSRKDQVREPVTGDEVLSVVKRRLLAAEPSADVALEVATEYGNVVGGYWRARAETPSAKQEAEEHALQLKNRMQAAYPFHPALIDVMNSRWTSTDFQRTRGALRFLACCLHSLKTKGGSKALLGPADIPLGDAEVVRAMMKDLDPRQEYSPVLTHDLIGPNARAKRIDERLAKETPALANVRPATRLATAILAYSFGGLRREAGAESLPPGVSESELLAACVGPDLDSITASAVLGELRNSCLYLHYDGIRYCFKKDANVTKLVEDAEQEIARDPDSIRDRIKELLEQRLAGRNDAIVWPATSQDLPDKEPRFLVAYMPLESASKTAAKQDEEARLMLSKHGEGPRTYRNGVALAMPDKKPIEGLRRAVRYLMAVERVENKKKQHKLTKDQEDQLKERRRTEEAAAETAFRQLYPTVYLPRVGTGGALDVEKVEVSGRPLQATGVHERVMELLTAVGTPKIHGTLHPRKIVERVKLGEPLAAGEPPRLGITTKDVCDAFFSFLEPPRISSGDVLRRAIVRGVGESLFGYCTGPPTLGPDGKYQIVPSKVAFGRTMTEDEVDLDSGFLMVPGAVPVPTPPPTGGVPGGPAPIAGGITTTIPGVEPSVGGAPATGPSAAVTGGGTPTIRTFVRIAFPASRDEVFKSFPAIANLADKSDGGKIKLVVEGQAAAGYDANWLRNAVQEPLDEASIEGLEITDK